MTGKLLAVRWVKIQRAGAMAVLGIALLAAAACGDGGDSGDMPGLPGVDELPGEATTIGSLLDVTGAHAESGPAARNAIDLAVALVNDAGGVNGTGLAVEHRDGGGSTVTAVDAARDLVTMDRVAGIIGPVSDRATMTVAEAVTIPAGVVLVSPASSSSRISDLDDGGLVYRTTVSDAAQGVVLARLALELGYESAATIFVNDDYGAAISAAFKDAFESQGGAVTGAVSQEPGRASYVSALARATSGDPDVLVAIGYPDSVGVYLREAIQGGYATAFLFADGAMSQEMFDAIGGGPYEGAFGTAPGSPDTPARQDFDRLYEERFGVLPDSLFMGESFDAAVLLALAIEKAGSTGGAAISSALRDVANAPGEKVGPGGVARALELIRAGQDVDYEGASGSQTINENGDVLNPVGVWQIVDGRITRTDRFEIP